MPMPTEAAPLLATLNQAAETRAVNDQQVVDALLELESTMRMAAKEDASISLETRDALDGAWRLIFTTGTVDTQKKLGARVNYFPVKAVQTFDTSSMEISNGIFLGDTALLKFYGIFEWNEKARRLNFDFDSIALLGLRFDLPKGGAAKIGASTGLGAESNVANAQRRELPAFFNWISADEQIATARGGGGGLALWRKVDRA